MRCSLSCCLTIINRRGTLRVFRRHKSEVDGRGTSYLGLVVGAGVKFLSEVYGHVNSFDNSTTTSVVCGGFENDHRYSFDNSTTRSP